MATTPKGIFYPGENDPNDIAGHLQSVAEYNDANPGIANLTTTQRNALSGGALWDGRVIFNTTAGYLEVYRTGTASWGPVVAGTIDATTATLLATPTSATAIALDTAYGKAAIRRQAAARGKRLRAAWNGNQRRRAPGLTVGSITTASTSAHETSLGSFTGTTSDDVLTTSSAHSLAVGDRVRIANKTGGSFINGNPYYVRSVPTSTTLTLFAGNASSGGIADLGSDITAGTLIKNPPTSYMTWNKSWGTVTITAADDTFTTASAHGLAVGDMVLVTGSTAAGVVNDTKYYVKTTPTSTTFTVAASLAGTGTTLDVTGDGTATLSRASTRYAFTDGRPRQRNTVFPAYDYTQWDVAALSVGAGVGVSGALTAHAIVTDQVCEVEFFNDGANATLVYVDGMLIDTVTSAQLAAAGVGSGSNGRRSYTFDTAGRRLVSLRSSGVLVGLITPFGKLIERPILDRGARWMFQGDSFTEGTGATIPASGGYVAQVAELLGLKDVWRGGQGSTGYTQDGSRLALIDRYQNDVIAQQPDVCVIAMGLNDTGLTTATVVADATTIWDAITAALPDTELIIVGPFPEAGGSGVTTANRNLDAALEAAAKTRSLRFISPIQDGLTFTRSDATHPDNAGHIKIGTYLAGHLATPYIPSAA